MALKSMFPDSSTGSAGGFESSFLSVVLGRNYNKIKVSFPPSEEMKNASAKSNLLLLQLRQDSLIIEI
jgi:hypothetical protein